MNNNEIAGMNPGMNQRIRSILLLAAITAVISSGAAGCVRGNGTPEDLLESVGGENKAALDSTVIMAGSTSMEQFANMAAESFMDRYSEMTVTVQFTGSSAGVEAVLAGRADIGNSSRDLKEKERASGAVAHVVAMDAIAVITDRGNKIPSLTVEQLSELYTGSVRNWQEIGGSDIPVVTVGREAGSGTRSTFEELLGIRDLCSYANELDSAGAVMARVAATPGAIGYVSFGILDDTVCVLAIDGIEAEVENVETGAYLLWQPYIMVTDGEINEQKDSVQRFFAYLWSEEGSQLIRKAGLIVPKSVD